MSFDGSSARKYERLTITDAYHQFYPDWAPDLSPASKQRHDFDLKRWRKLMGEIAVTDLTTADYQRFRKLSRESGQSASTTETTIRTVKQIMQVCHTSGVIRHIPHAGRARKIPAPEPHVPTMEQLDLLYRATESRTWPRGPIPAPTWWKALLCVACWTGLRREDLFWRLSWEHIRENRIEYRASKTGKLHQWPLIEPVRRHLEAVRFDRNSIFDTPKNLKGIRNNLRELSAAAGIQPAVTSQTLRQIAVNLWSTADSKAGGIVHGENLGVLRHYLDQFRFLESVAPDVTLPPSMEAFGSGGENQLTLF